MQQFPSTFDALYAVGPCVVMVRGWEHRLRLVPERGQWCWDYGCYEEAR